MPKLPGLKAALNGDFRIGFHNDCFLASRTDVGTYSENATERAGQQRYAADLSALAPFGGETCNPADEADPTPRTACSSILSEGARYHLTYLNDDYYRPLFHNKWIKNGCIAEVQRSIGYRISLVGVTHPNRVVRGTPFALSVVIRNSGWARLYNLRPLEVVQRNRMTGAVRRIEVPGADPRRWLPGTSVPMLLKINLPIDLATGTYEVWLALPDGDRRLRGDSRYAIRPANRDDAAKGQKWNARLGAFATGTTTQVR